MALGLSLRVSWICLLLFSSGACFPATKGDYRYPYTASGGGSAPGSNLQSEGSTPPLVSLQYEPSASYQQPAAAPQLASSPTGNKSPSSLGTPSVAAGSSPSYEPNRFIVTYDSSSHKPSSAPGVPSQSAGYVSPPVGPLPPAGTGKKTPSFSVQPQSAASTGGKSNVGSDVAAPIPVYGASFPAPSSFAYPAKNAGNMEAAPYDAAPATNYFAGPAPYDAAPATNYFAAPVAYDAATATNYFAAPVAYDAAPATNYFAGPAHYDTAPYGSPSSAGSLPAGGADSSFYNPSSWMPPFPEFNVLDFVKEMPQSASETSPLPPSSYISQSRNDYQRARKLYSHTKYYPEYPEPPVYPFEAAKAPSKSPPKGGRKI